MRSTSDSGSRRSLRQVLSGLGLAAVTLLLAACSDNNAIAPRGGYGYMGAPESAAGPMTATNQMPGLGTQAGEVRLSRVDTGAFIRQREKDPLEVVALYYNSEEGLQAMLRTPVLPKGRAKFLSPNGYLEYGITTPGGKALRGFEASGRRFVQGKSGDRYALYVRNMTKSRIEVVMSVDGLDVIDRGAASFEKRGYILDPGEKLKIEGFRVSSGAIQTFRFGSVSSSQAAQSYGARGAANAGVVGFAFFPESTSQPYGYRTGDIQRREMANPFPQSF